MYVPRQKVGRVAPRAPLSVASLPRNRFPRSVRSVGEIPRGLGVRHAIAPFTFSARRLLQPPGRPARTQVPKGRPENSTTFQRRVRIAKSSSPEGTAEFYAAQ